VSIQTVNEYLQLADWKFEFSIDEGRLGKFCWLRSGHLFAGDFLRVINLPKNPFQVLVTYFDGQDGGALTYGDRPGWRKLGLFAISESSSALPALSFGADNEQLILDEPMPDPELLSALALLDEPYELDDLADTRAKDFWTALEIIKPYCYFSNGIGRDEFTLIVRDEDVYRQFCRSLSGTEIETTFKNVEANYRARVWDNLGPECGPEACIEDGCDRLRIKLAVRCFIHQIQWGDSHG